VNLLKRDLFISMLSRTGATLTINPGAEYVQVPEQLRKDPQITLDVDYNIPVDLHIDDWGFAATLLFNSTPYFCVIPWHAVVTINDPEQNYVIFMRPIEAAPEKPKPAQKKPAQKKPEPQARRGGILRLVK